MAEISKGNEKRSGSFKFFGRSPARTPKRSSSNPFSKIFSRSNRRIDENNVPQESEISNMGIDEFAAAVVEETVPTIIENSEEAASKVVEQLVHHANIENPVQEMEKADLVAKFKELTPETVEKKHDFFHKIIDKAEKTMDKLQGKAKEGLQKTAHEGKETYEPLIHKGKGPDEHPLNDKSSQVRSADTDDEAKVPLSSLAHGLEDEPAAVARAATEVIPEDAACHGDNLEKDEGKQEENCVTSLAEGLHKICCQWTNNKKED